ncbi:unnamed protein product [Orchesella dallaii]|uniref:Chromo domain-containing protein n=1 Tax=Orchesella dallaii TaxID=48710 RepID=A0ABP1RKC5_9HEXA
MTSITEASSSLSSDQYIVERILRKRIGATGEAEYFLKWQGYSDNENTWEPAGHINADLILEFEKKTEEDGTNNQLEKKEQSSKMKSGAKKEVEQLKKRQLAEDGDEPVKKPRKRNSKKEDHPIKYGFDRGLEAEEIIGASFEKKRLKFLIKWKGDHGVEMVPAEVANVKCTQLVIGYYEERVFLTNAESNTAE